MLLEAAVNEEGTKGTDKARRRGLPLLKGRRVIGEKTRPPADVEDQAEHLDTGTNSAHQQFDR